MKPSRLADDFSLVMLLLFHWLLMWNFAGGFMHEGTPAHGLKGGASLQTAILMDMKKAATRYGCGWRCCFGLRKKPPIKRVAAGSSNVAYF